MQIWWISQWYILYQRVGDAHLLNLSMIYYCVNMFRMQTCWPCQRCILSRHVGDTHLLILLMIQTMWKIKDAHTENTLRLHISWTSQWFKLVNTITLKDAHLKHRNSGEHFIKGHMFTKTLKRITSDIFWRVWCTLVYIMFTLTNDPITRYVTNNFTIIS